MDPVELSRWVPPTIMATALILMARHYGAQFIERIQKLEDRMEKILLEAAKNVTVEHHKSSISDIHNKINAMGIAVAEISAELKFIHRGVRK